LKEKLYWARRFYEALEKVASILDGETLQQGQVKEGGAHDAEHGDENVANMDYHVNVQQWEQGDQSLEAVLDVLESVREMRQLDLPAPASGVENSTVSSATSLTV